MADLRHLLAIYVHAHRTGNSVPPHIDAEARAALADEPAVPQGREPASVTGQPSDEDLRDLWSWAAGQDQGPWPTQHHCFARAVLARWGNPAPTPPADGEQRVMTDLTPEHTSRRTEGDLHPEVREAYKYVDSVVATADFEHPLAWCGWALREAFLAGCTHARAALPPAIISDLSFSHPQTAMAEQRSDLHQLALQALKGVHEQREEILRAFVAKYQCQPDDAVQAMQTTVEGDRHVTRYWIEKSKRMPAPPADGEVAELAAELHNFVAAYKCCHNHDHIWSLSGSGINARLTVTLITRAAELLQQQALPGVAVSERPPGPEDRDAEGRSWWFIPASVMPNGTCPCWCLAPAESPRSWFTHWRPANAMPIPQQQESDNG